MRHVYRSPSAAEVVGLTLIGAIVGLGATWARERVAKTLRERERPSVRNREDVAHRGRPPLERVADRSSRLLGRGPLMRRERQQWARRIQYGVGAGAGAAYGAWLAYRPEAGLARAASYGAALFLAMDEGLPQLVGGWKPRALPWQSHARGLVGQLTYGVATHAALSALKRPLLAG